MTLKRQLTLMTLLVVILSVLLNTAISSTYLDTFFKGYIQKQYDQRIEKLKVASSNYILKTKDYENLSAVELTRSLEEPIVNIAILNEKKQLLVTASSKAQASMHNNMMRNKRFFEETELLQDQFELKNKSQTIGYLVVTRNSSLKSTESVMLFKAALRMGALISGLVALAFATILTTYMSRRLNKDLMKVADYAGKLQESPQGMSALSNTTEINALILSLNDLSSKLKLQNDVQKRRADQLAHEARTPLTLLRTQLEGALDGVVDMDKARLESCLHEIETLTKTISHLDQVLDFSDETLTPDYKVFDLSLEVRKIMRGMKLQFEQKNIMLNAEMPQEFFVNSDKVLLSQIVYNLLTNAYKFTPEGGSVLLKITEVTTSEKTLLHLIIEDSGQGIDPSLHENLFKPYYRDPSVRHVPGEGLGLYITKRNVQAMKGEIGLENSNKGGCIAWVKLPI